MVLHLFHFGNYETMLIMHLSQYRNCELLLYTKIRAVFPFTQFHLSLSYSSNIFLQSYIIAILPMYLTYVRPNSTRPECGVHSLMSFFRYPSTSIVIPCMSLALHCFIMRITHYKTIFVWHIITTGGHDPGLCQWVAPLKVYRPEPVAWEWTLTFAPPQ